MLIVAFMVSWGWIHDVGKAGGPQEGCLWNALPLESEKLYSGSSDGTVRTWDCHFGKCAQLSNLGDEVGSLITEGSWVFIGMKGVIKVWDMDTLQCIKTLNGHEDAVMSLLHWRASSCNDNTFHLYDLPSFTERGRLFSKQEVRVIDRGPFPLFLHRGWKWVVDCLEVVAEAWRRGPWNLDKPCIYVNILLRNLLHFSCIEKMDEGMQKPVEDIPIFTQNSFADSS
ncbi:hypothetical protein QUC31_003892 [Theobroma cacao]